MLATSPGVLSLVGLAGVGSILEHPGTRTTKVLFDYGLSDDSAAAAGSRVTLPSIANSMA